MKTVTVALNVNHLSALEQTSFTDVVVTSLTGNALLPNSSALVPILSQCNDDLKASVKSAALGALNGTSDVQDKQAELVRTLKWVGASVEYEAHNNETTVLSSGFEIGRNGTHVSKTFHAKHGVHSGTVDLETKRVDNSSYIWEYTLDPLNQSDWVRASTSMQSKYTVTGLTPALKYWFRVAVVTKAGEQPHSDPYMVLVI